MPHHLLRLTVRQRIAAIAIVMSLLVVGCATIEDLAPPVDATLIELAGAHQIDIDRLSRGRELYITACAQCHRPEPVVRYAQDQWRGILRRMSMYARLAPDDAEALRAYVVTTLDASKSHRSAAP